MSKIENRTIKFFFLIAIVLGVVISIRFFFVLRMVILGGILITAVGLGIYFLYKLIRERKMEKAYRESTEGIINEQMRYCQSQLKENQYEIEKIDLDIEELREKLKKPIELPEKTRKQSEKIIEAFQKERALRKAKLEFFKQCIDKLRVLLHNHETQRTLDEKKEKLRLLQENNYESLADLEEFKSGLEYQKNYVEAIDRLSLKMLESNTLDDAEVLTLELLEMTKELERL